jgi:hypothetical protein
VLLAALEQAHVAVKEMVVEPGADPADTVRLLLRLPRGLTKAGLASLISETKNAQILELT